MKRFVIYTLAMTLCLVAVGAAFAATPLNSSNRLGSDGAYYWNIYTSGAYYLDIPDTVFSTSH